MCIFISINNNQYAYVLTQFEHFVTLQHAACMCVIEWKYSGSVCSQISNK